MGGHNDTGNSNMTFLYKINESKEMQVEVKHYLYITFVLTHIE